MIPDLLLRWALVGVSLFNTILLLWLGLTLWLNADRREAGVVVTAAGFVLGSLVFISHSALILSDSLAFTRSNTLWLAVGMAPVVLLPYVWYVVLLWYAGYWTAGDVRLRRRQRPWLGLATAVLLFGFICLILLGVPYVPLVNRLTSLILPLRQAIKTPLAGIPLVALGYPPYVLLCVLLSLDALRRPGSTARMMGGLARQRARPWLATASLLLFLVGLLVAAVLIWAIGNTKVGGYYILSTQHLEVIGLFDLAISLLIAAVIVLLGQAIAAYELFTGKMLPRRSLARQWRQAIVLAAGYGWLMGGALAWGLEPVYAVLLTALLMTAFFALQSWRANAEWEHAMQQLRPFVASSRWYDSLLAEAEGDPDPAGAFEALCRDLLNASTAYLIPAGPTAAFVEPLSYPAGRSCPGLGALNMPAGDLAGQLAVAVAAETHGGATWAVPLWRERGLIGVLLLGPRRDDGLFTQEALEIARATGERLIDTAASLALSQRLMRLQRERMAASQLLDQRTRRVLHDEVLPLIHAALLSLSAGAPQRDVARQLADAHQQVSNLLRDLPMATTPDIARLGFLPALRRMVEVEFSAALGQVEWRCAEGVDEQVARLSPLAAETLYYATRELVRNAARHARPADPAVALRLQVSVESLDGQLSLTIQDNGAGFEQPVSGQGLALHSTLIAIAGGSLSLGTIPGQMTRTRLSMPLSQDWQSFAQHPGTTRSGQGAPVLP